MKLHSTFAGLEFLFRFDRPFFWPAARLNPELLNLSYETTHGWNSEPQNIECRTAACDELSRVECRRVESLCSVFFKIDRSTTEAHDGQNSLLRHSTFIIRYSLFLSFFLTGPAAFQASGRADPSLAEHLKPNMHNTQHHLRSELDELWLHRQDIACRSDEPQH
jgi:hypothetical protein